MAARFSKGDRRTWAYSGPPTYSTKPPSSSLRAVSTSSSSSTDSTGALVKLGPTMPCPELCGELTIKERYELISCAFGTKGEGDGRQATNGIQSEQDIIVLLGRRLVCEEGKGYEAEYWPTLSSSMSTAIGYSSSLCCASITG